MHFVVCGLHMRGLALNGQLVSAGSTFVRAAETTANYTMHALKSTDSPSKPGLVLHPDGSATAAPIPVEVWDVPEEAIGALLKFVPSPLAFGTVYLTDGKVSGFVCEGWAADSVLAAKMGITSTDITHYGGWRKYAEQQMENDS